MDIDSLPFNLVDVIDMTEVYGVIGFGSYFKQAQRNNSGDIDLLVISKSKILRKEAISHQGYLIDLTQCSFHVLKKLMTRVRDKLHWQENLINSQILSDPKGLVSEFLKETLLTEIELIEVDCPNIREMKGAIDNCVRKVMRYDSTITQFHYISVWIQNCYNLQCYSNELVPLQHKPEIDKHIKAHFPALHDVIIRLNNIAIGKQRAQLMKNFIVEHIEHLYPQVSPFGVIKELIFSGSKLGHSKQTLTVG